MRGPVLHLRSPTHCSSPATLQEGRLTPKASQLTLDAPAFPVSPQPEKSPDQSAGQKNKTQVSTAERDPQGSGKEVRNREITCRQQQGAAYRVTSVYDTLPHVLPSLTHPPSHAPRHLPPRGRAPGGRVRPPPQGAALQPLQVLACGTRGAPRPSEFVTQTRTSQNSLRPVLRDRDPFFLQMSLPHRKTRERG